MFTMNPLGIPDAALYHGIMLFVAGTLGFVIGYVSRRRQIIQLQGDLAGTECELTDCHRAPATQVDQEALILSRVRARADEIDLDRIGRFTAVQADNLRRITGVGPLLEKKLHAVGIYTFRQLATLTRDDVTLINDIIVFFPGRIERDDWVGQAAAFLRDEHKTH